MTMVERVARAIMISDLDGEDHEGREWQAWKPDALAAIAAMREPSGGMNRAGWTVCCDAFMDINEVPAMQGDVWQAMIDAALAE